MPHPRSTPTADRARRRRARTTPELPFVRHGGARRGAGRKPQGARERVPHTTRLGITRHVPLLVTSRLRAGLPSLRSKDSARAAFDAFARGCQSAGFRVVAFSLQTNHVHALVEVRDARSLASGMTGLLVRLARALNRVWRRRGPVFDDSFHARALAKPRAVRFGLVYVLDNARRHGIHVDGADACSSARWFPGAAGPPPANGRAAPVAPPESWLLRVGWRSHGAYDPRETPGKRTAKRTLQAELEALCDGTPRTRARSRR